MFGWNRRHRTLVVAPLAFVGVSVTLAPASMARAAFSPGPAVASPPTATVVPLTMPDLTAFAVPIAGACLPSRPLLLPNASRSYRRGIHEGVDFYDADNCTRITRGTPVRAAKGGRVVRADVEFVAMSRKDLRTLLVAPQTEEILDAWRGRQVWIDHGGGVATRYAHLDHIARDIREGSQVRQGQIIAVVGETGTPASLLKPGHEYHLHFEVRIGDDYLGRALGPSGAGDAYRIVFGMPSGVKPTR